MPENIITLGTYSFERAQIVKTVLEANQIDCFIQNANILQGAISAGVKVRIREEDLESALRLVENLFKPKPVAEDGDLVSKSGKARILVPTDFSDYSRKAAEIALDLAIVTGAELTLMHTYFDPVINALPFTDAYMYDVNMEELAVDLKDSGEKNLQLLKDALAEKVKSRPGATVTFKTMLSKGVAEDEIVRYARLYRPTLIVMGTRGKDKKSSDFIGSVTAEVIETARVPVLAIPEDFAYRGIEHMNNVLYATNFEESDFKALELLEVIVKPLQVNIHCIHFESSLKSRWDEVRIQGLRDYMSKRYQETKVVCNLVDTTDFSEGVEKYIKENDISMLCVTTRRRNIISRLFNPSVAKRMLFHSTTPLLVFHAR
ncbi:nucleotide-binding universal stress UspA family protein [Breznakibacter xylanolyticus]|uniref:Nucleotide-binding universal stress UspA family protein n=1 Tax=Breznakibacter xylanolyticus TaxID=990 RepID=A0A2W7MQD0_9BACT|nr:universal stress protein [Breznakibacter xylanolyticus]PZX09641.1 nucleotide-binding universal stress UspA family protein [Breznakibacter xylanolyticus]